MQSQKYLETSHVENWCIEDSPRGEGRSTRHLKAKGDHELKHIKFHTGVADAGIQLYVTTQCSEELFWRGDFCPEMCFRYCLVLLCCFCSQPCGAGRISYGE